MLVRATATGFSNNHQKSKGDVFVISDDLFSPVWMEKLEDTHKEETVIQRIKNKLGGK